MAVYAVGDLQGCLKPLQCLLERVAFDPAQDQLWLVGDLVNRGPQSLETLRFLYAMRESLVCVLGNHDLHFLACVFGFAKVDAKDQLGELLKAPDLAELTHWLQQQPLMHFQVMLLQVPRAAIALSMLEEQVHIISLRVSILSAVLRLLHAILNVLLPVLTLQVMYGRASLPANDHKK